MKNLIAITLLLFPLIGYSQATEFSWLVGKWKLKGKETYEVWKISSDKKTLEGISFGVKGIGTEITERMKIRKEKDIFYFTADLEGSQPEVAFKFTSSTAKGFTAENAANDFPKIIRYQLLSTSSLKAEIEGNGKVVPFDFEKMK